MLKPTVGVVSLGCNKNRVDSEIMLGILRDAGHPIVADPSQAEIIIVNTCGFIQSAKEEAIDTILDMARFKDEGACRLLIATGCLTQRYSKELYEEMPEVDAFLGVSDYDQLLGAIERAQGTRVLCVGEADRAVNAGARVLTTASHTAYLKVAEGCDNRCAYCAIPDIRGHFRSRSLESLVEEAQQLARQGVRELVLTAQDTTRYGEDFGPGGPRLADLVAEVCRIEGIRWVRALYFHPMRTTPELLRDLARHEKYVRYLDLPIQHIDDDMLRAMNRHCTSADIRRILSAARALDYTLRTTLIAGFPGETPERFEALCDFVREVRFERLGAFAYSAEEGTPAESYPDAVEESERQRRAQMLMEIQQPISKAACEARVGGVEEVLVERFENGCWVGRARADAPEVDGLVYFTAAEQPRAGEFVSVRIASAGWYDVEGVRV